MKNPRGTILKGTAVAGLQSLASRLADGTRHRGALERPTRLVLSFAPFF
jgi:hypothetical protein